MKNFLIVLFLFPLFLFAQERNTGFIASGGILLRTDESVNFSYEVGIYTHLAKTYIYASYGVEKYGFLKIGGGGNINSKIMADFGFIFFTTVGFYDVAFGLPKHFGGVTSFYLRKAFTPYLRISLTTLEPAIDIGLRYQLNFID